MCCATRELFLVNSCNSVDKCNCQNNKYFFAVYENLIDQAGIPSLAVRCKLLKLCQLYNILNGHVNFHNLPTSLLLHISCCSTINSVFTHLIVGVLTAVCSKLYLPNPNPNPNPNLIRSKCSFLCPQTDSQTDRLTD